MSLQPGDRIPGRPRCPACLTLLDGFTSVRLDGAVPKPGDPTVCMYCASLLVFGDRLQFRFPTDAELVEFEDVREIKVARDAAMRMIQEYGDKWGGA